jgi:DNA adenine methylase
MKRMPQPIPYQGSKRSIAGQILSLTPPGVEKLIGPFAGSAALSIRAAYEGVARSFHLNDLNAPLASLLQSIIETPEEIAAQYETLWTEQAGREKFFYDTVRRQFNKTRRPDLLLFLMARCVKGAVRYNSNGEFNQGPDNRRRGRHPQSMRQEILAVSQLLKGRTTVSSLHYREMIRFIDPACDFVYMDPPYQGTSTNRDPRYFSGISVADLAGFLAELNSLRVLYALSYDGHKGGKHYGIELPGHLNLVRAEINAGRSSQSTLLGHNHTTFESLYLSPALIDRLSPQVVQAHLSYTRPEQLTLLST